jgi:hypothetical protein
MTSVVNINEVLDGHVSLEIDCVDRLLLNAYAPNLQVGGQVVTFLTEHLGFPIPSPALLEKIGNRFRREVKAFAVEHGVPILALKKPDRTRWDDRKLDHVRSYLDKAEADGRTGVVAIVQTQEFQWVFSAKNRSSTPGVVSFDFVKEDRRVGMYYFYVLDAEFGPGFIKICTYFPYPAKVWLNGHEWAKRQARHAGICFGELANGFASCEDPVGLQAICDRFGPVDIQGFFDRWSSVIPTPFTDDDRRAGYFWELSMRQVEVSRTLVFDDPRRARGFFEALVADNIGIGRPEQMAMVFAAQLRTRGPRSTKGRFGTRDFSPGTEVKIDFSFKHSRVKQYLKEGRALRIETVINKPKDIGVLARLEHLPELVEKARQINDRLLMIERAGQGCAIGSALFERIHQPYIREGPTNRSPALRGSTRHGPGRLALPRRPRRHRLHQQEPSRAGGRTPRQGLQLFADELRPATSSPPRTDRTTSGNQLLHRYPRGNPRRRLLYQAARSTARTTARRRQTPGTSRASACPRYGRARPRRLRRERATWSRRLKLVTKSRGWWTKKNYAAPETSSGAGALRATRHAR